MGNTSVIKPEGLWCALDQAPLGLGRSDPSEKWPPTYRPNGLPCMWRIPKCCVSLEAQRLCAVENLRLAEQLGAEP